jgi:predicted nuclease with TOPRIM domain
MELDGILSRIEAKIDTIQDKLAQIDVLYAKVEERLKLGADKMATHDRQIEDLQKLFVNLKMNGVSRNAMDLERQKTKETMRLIAELLIALTAISSLALSIMKL